MAKLGAKSTTRQAWLSQTKLYGFELFMAAFGLTVAAIVIDYGLFAFFNYLMSEGSAEGYIGEGSLVIVAAMVIWLPLALLFYLRSRGEQTRNAKRTSSTLHKVMVSILLFVNILLAAGAAFAAVYSLFQIAIGADMTPGEMLMRVTVPALLMALLHAWVCFAFSSVRFAGRRVFAMSFLGIGVVVMAALLLVSFGTVRAAAMDDHREDDLRLISDAIRDDYRNSRQLPSSLADLDFEADDLRFDVDDYYYDRKSLGRYELCADFAADTSDDYTRYDDVEEYRRTVIFRRIAKAIAAKGPAAVDLRLRRPNR